MSALGPDPIGAKGCEVWDSFSPALFTGREMTGVFAAGSLRKMQAAVPARCGVAPKIQLHPLRHQNSHASVCPSWSAPSIDHLTQALRQMWKYACICCPSKKNFFFQLIFIYFFLQGTHSLDAQFLCNPVTDKNYLRQLFGNA